jgi:hypothetical protein
VTDEAITLKFDLAYPKVLQFQECELQIAFTNTEAFFESAGDFTAEVRPKIEEKLLWYEIECYFGYIFLALGLF